MKKLVLFFALLMIAPVFADETVSLTTPQNISFETCTKMFAINKEKLFYLTLGAISANKFAVDEIQTANGYIIFTAANNKYLATIASIDPLNSILKITPCNDIYYFQPGIVLNMFKYVDVNLNTEIKG
ncbi:MAG: hypothetical protein NC408_02415 [Candidatus Gastranaerophilales bacterium]|nr:hypothetical protein [Candidatus Gastranaerophilales bacterium]MCM1073561.1 hypothetical protein [Bacteroides sp.]